MFFLHHEIDLNFPHRLSRLLFTVFFRNCSGKTSEQFSSIWHKIVFFFVRTKIPCTTHKKNSRLVFSVVFSNFPENTKSWWFEFQTKTVSLTLWLLLYNLEKAELQTFCNKLYNFFLERSFDGNFRQKLRDKFFVHIFRQLVEHPQPFSNQFTKGLCLFGFYFVKK